MSEVLTVLTYKSADSILEAGGTQSWVLDRNRASKCKYVVACRNATTRNPEGPEPHGTAFMVGKVKDIVPSTEDEGRWLVKIYEYALINIEDEWEGRNPVQYWGEKDFGIDFESLDFCPVKNNLGNLTISGAKKELSRSLGVPEASIEIIIRG